jgi:hypothetical protein
MIFNAEAKTSIGFLNEEARDTQWRLGEANMNEGKGIGDVLLESLGLSRRERIGFPWWWE